MANSNKKNELVKEKKRKKRKGFSIKKNLTDQPVSFFLLNWHEPMTGYPLQQTKKLVKNQTNNKERSLFMVQDHTYW